MWITHRLSCFLNEERFFSAYPTERDSSRCTVKMIFLIEIFIDNFVSMVFFVIKRSVRSSSSSEMHREAVFLVPGFYPNEENFLLSPSYAFGCDNFQARDPNDANKNSNNSMSYAVGCQWLAGWSERVSVTNFPQIKSNAHNLMLQRNPSFISKGEELHLPSAQFTTSHPANRAAFICYYWVLRDIEIAFLKKEAS